MLDVCDREVILKILADDRYCGRVIGKEGKVIKKIREDTDTHIVVSKSVADFFCSLRIVDFGREKYLIHQCIHNCSAIV